MIKDETAGLVLKIRVLLGLSQSGLAERLYVGAAAVSNWERGMRKPRLGHIRDLVNLAKNNGIEIAMSDFVELV